MSAVSITSEVADRFHGLRRAYLFSQIAISVLAACCLWAVCWVALAVADYHFELPLQTRHWLMMGLSSVVVVWLLVRVIRIVRRVQESSFAEHLETTFTGFGQRIRTVLDTVNGRVSGPEEMLSALGHQTMGRWETLSPEQLLPRRSLSIALLAAVVAGGLCAALFFRGGDWTTAMNRAIGGTETYTQLSVNPGNQRVLEGATIDVSLTLTGRTNRDVSLRHRMVSVKSEDAEETADQSSDDWIEFTLEREPESVTRTDGTRTDGTRMDGTDLNTGVPAAASSRKANFTVSLGRARQAVEYQFLTSVGNSQIHRIDVQPLIKAVEVATLVTPPEYTRLKQRRFTSRRVTVLEGSDVLVTVRTNHPLKTAELEVSLRSKSASQTPQKFVLPAGDDPNVWQFPLSSEFASNWKLSGSGPDGTPMATVKGRATIRKDAGPKISFREPGENLEVHTLAEVPMAVQVSDDYGLQECGIVFELGDEGQFVLTDWIFDDSEATQDNTTRVKLNEVLPLESFQLTERDFISYYAYAVDNREGSPQRTESDIRYIDIRELRQFYREQDPPPSDGGSGGGGLRASLVEIIRRERFLVNRTRRLTRSAKSDLDSQLGTIERMVESQSDLAGLVRSLAEFMVDRGNDDVSALNQAESLMLQASDSLAAASFDLALIQQNDSLLALAEARRTLEIILRKRMTRRQRQEMARFNQRLKQKLRRERPQTDEQLADSLEQIASTQMRLGMTVARQSQQSASTASGHANANSMGSKPASPDAATPDAEAKEPNEDSVEKTEPDASAPNDAAASDNPAPDNPAPGDPAPGDSAPDSTESDSTQSDSIAPDLAAADDQMEEGDDRPPTPFEQQVEILERFQAISSDLQAREDLSDLFQSRIEQLTEELDQLTTTLQQQEGETDSSDDGRFVRSSVNAAAALSELSLHLKAQQSGVAVRRIGRLSDLTRQQSGLEHSLSLKTEQQIPSSTPDGLSEFRPVSLDAAQVAAQAVARAMTIEDVLQIPVEMGDVETSEVNDVMKAFVEETEFDLLLQKSRDVAGEIAEANRATIDTNASGEALKRAIEYAEISAQLDELYNELVAPRLKQLRKLEQQACQLQGTSGGGSGGTKPQGKKPKPKNKSDMDKAEKKAAMAELKKELQAAGLKELAKLLDSAGMSDQKIQQMMASSNNSGKTAITADTDPMSNTDAARLQLLVKKLRDQIQQAILLEISADRNAAVPAEYEKLVDGYFRSLAEGASE